MLQIQICVPNSSVGAIIGAGGSNIKQIIRDSNAFVTIEPKRDDDPNPAAERTVTIKGSMDAQWRVRTLKVHPQRVKVTSFHTDSKYIASYLSDQTKTNFHKNFGCILSLSLEVNSSLRVHLY